MLRHDGCTHLRIGNPVTPDSDPVHEPTGDRSLRVDEVLPEVYRELKSLAKRHLRDERANHSLQPSALVNEAYMRLRASGGEFASRSHFFAAASESIRRILIEHARRRLALKRGGAAERVSLEYVTSLGDVAALRGGSGVDVIELEHALQELERMDPRLGRVVTLRFFGGLTVDEVAVALGLSKRTVESDWTMARAWLRRALSKGAEGGET